MKDKVKDLEERLYVDNVIDKQEQYSRRDCFLLQEVEESNDGSADDLVINILNKELNE